MPLRTHPKSEAVLPAIVYPSKVVEAITAAWAGTLIRASAEREMKEDLKFMLEGQVTLWKE
jgi:hypothetical protein